MGYGSYTASDWAKLKTSRNLSTSASADQTFTNSEIQDKYNAKFIDIRESFDSDDSPESTPVIIGFDVTGSMGYLANEIATRALNETIMQILAKKPVSDPHMMCAAFTQPSAPLQVTQFEADIRVIEQLLDFRLGGGNWYAYDTILWYFAAKHTKTDCNVKRHKKGILIGIGDEVCGEENNFLMRGSIEQLFNDRIKENVLDFKTLLRMAREKYDVVHIVVGDEQRFDRTRRSESYTGWRDALPGFVAKLPANNIGCLAEVIVAVMQILNGVSQNAVLEGIAESKREVVRKAIEDFTGANPIDPKQYRRSLLWNR